MTAQPSPSLAAIKKMSVFDSRKMRNLDTQPAWITVEDVTFGGTTYEVMKNNQADTIKQYATCMVKAVSSYTGPHGDMGDTYWAQIYAGALVKVDGREPTADERVEWATLKALCAPDPMSALGF